MIKHLALILLFARTLCAMQSVNEAIVWVNEDYPFNHQTSGRKANVIWDEFTRYRKVAKKSDTNEPVKNLNNKTKARCNNCGQGEISGIWMTMCNHLIHCPQTDDATKKKWIQLKKDKQIAAPPPRKKRRITDDTIQFLHNLPPLNAHNDAYRTVHINSNSNQDKENETDGYKRNRNRNSNHNHNHNITHTASLSIIDKHDDYDRFIDPDHKQQRNVKHNKFQTHPKGITLEDTQTADRLCAEWIINRPHIPFTEARDEYHYKFIKFLCPSYEPPNRNRISGQLLTEYECSLKNESKNVLCDADLQNWTMCYDGSSDRCAEKTVHIMLCNPKPLIHAIEGHDNTGYYGAEEHYLQMERNYSDFEKNEKGKVKMLMTDNEATMTAARGIFHEHHPEIFCPGCPIHVLSLHIKNGIFVIFEDLGKDINKVQDCIKNTKLREGLKEMIIGDNDKRLGMQEPGSTRWGSKDDEIQAMLRRKSSILTVSHSQKYKQYAIGIASIIEKKEFWTELSSVAEPLRMCRLSIDRIHGIETLGAAYYSFLRLFEYYADKKEENITALGDEYDPDDYEINGYEEVIDDHDEMGIYKKNIRIYTKLRANLLKYWKMCNVEGDQCFLIAFMFDARFVEQRNISSNDKRVFKERIKLLYENDNKEMEKRKLLENVATLNKFTRNFREKRGIFRGEWKLHPYIDKHSSWDKTLDFLEAIKDDNEGNELLQWWCGLGIIYCSMIASQGRIESSFNPIKKFMTANRGSIGIDKLRRLDYCYNQSRNLQRFQPKWKPIQRKEKENDMQ